MLLTTELTVIMSVKLMSGDGHHSENEKTLEEIPRFF